jgi:putative transcriptional regulator
VGLRFEWDEFKAKENYARHGISFDLATAVFSDPFALELLDDRRDYGEDRFVIIGLAEGQLLMWPTPNATKPSASSQLGGRRSMRKKPILNRSRKRIRSMTPKNVESAALADPDAQPLSRSDLKRMKRTPQAKVIRRALGVTQEEFAARYHIPLGTLRDWEQGRAVPDQPSRAYLTVIARDPDRVRQALSTD